MKKFLPVLASLIVFATSTHATIRRVGFFLPLVANVDYVTVQAAHDASSAGDTILIMPAATFQVNISKPLVFIGPGYLLDSTANPAGNGGLQANTSTNTNSGTVTFLTGSNGTIIEGCTVNNIAFSGNGVSNILIERCNLTGNCSFANNAGTITLQQCLITGVLNSNGGPTTPVTITNLSLNNCLITSQSFQPQIYFGNSNYTVYCTMSNCVDVSGGLTIATSNGAWLVTNSIFSYGVEAFYFNGSNTSNIIFINNISLDATYPFDNTGTNSGNFVSTFANVFTQQGSFDSQWQLKSGSPATGAGLIGTSPTDIGLFGGSTPYVLSGIPAVPTIYRISSPNGVVGSGGTYTVNISTRSNN